MCLYPLIGGSLLRWQRQGNSVKARQDKPGDGCRKAGKVTVRAGRREEERRILPEIKTRLDNLLQTDGLPIWQTESEQIQLGKLQEELDNILCIGDRD